MGQTLPLPAIPPAWTRPFMPDYAGAAPVALAARSWSGVGVYVKGVRFFAPFCTDITHDCARLSIVLDLSGGQPDARDSIARPTPLAFDTIHQMNYAPARSAVWAASNDTEYFRVISFTFDHETIASLIDDDICVDRFLAPRLMFFDPVILQLARLFELECLSDATTDTLQGDTLALALLQRFAGTPDRAPRRGGLSPRQLAQTVDYLMTHMTESVSVIELAQLNRLSRPYFIRAFRDSTGTTPHQWLVRARLRRARALLHDARLSIAAIAQAVGFADHAHFTRIFKRVTGITPAAWRRQTGQ